MSPSRLSAWKTSISAAFAMVASTAVCLWLARGVTNSNGQWRPVPRVGAAVLMVAAISMGVWLALVLTGGMIALRRDSLEARGTPYAPGEPRERRAPRLTRTARRVDGDERRRRDVPRPLRLRPGELVEVRSMQEILTTLDQRGRLDELMFMPEMAALSGQRFRVFRRVDKLNDWVDHTGLRQLTDTVLLDGLRCDGSGHDGCQARCYTRWKESWLRRVDDTGARTTDAPIAIAATTATAQSPGALDLYQLAKRTDAETQEERWVCQATELSAGTTPLRWGDPRHYLRDLHTGNIRPRPLLVGVALAAFNRVQRARRGVTFPTKDLPDRSTSPDVRLGLKPGDLVRVKTKADILATLNSNSRNRGLWFDIEMMRYCGEIHTVTVRVERLIEERSGRMRAISNPCVILDDLGASGEYVGFCAQNEAIFWREIWLDRVDPAEDRHSAETHT
jgi:hypothetical protein